MEPATNEHPSEAPVPLRPDETIGDAVQSRWHTRAGRTLASVVRRSRDWFAADVVLTSMLVSSLVVLSLVVWGTGELYRGVKDANGLAGLDQPVLDWLVAIRTPPADAAVTSFTHVGGPRAQPLLLAPVAAFLAWRWRSWTPPVLCALSYAGADILTRFGKDLTGRARPPVEAAVPPFEVTPSFPSGHALFAVVVAGIVAYLLLHWFRTKAARVACLVGSIAYAAAMGLSRVYLGHHWLTDVVAGWLLGLGWVWVLATVHRLWLTARRRHGEPRFGRLTVPR